MSTHETRRPLRRAATGLGGAILGAIAGFSVGMMLGAVAAALLSRVVSADGEGWEVLWAWVLCAFGGTGIGAVVGLILGVRRRRPSTPARPDTGARATYSR
jgi:MFS family permease